METLKVKSQNGKTTRSDSRWGQRGGCQYVNQQKLTLEAWDGLPEHNLQTDPEPELVKVHQKFQQFVSVA